MCLGTLHLAGTGRMSGSDACSPLTQDISGKKTLKGFHLLQAYEASCCMKKNKETVSMLSGQLGTCGGEGLLSL